MTMQTVRSVDVGVVGSAETSPAAPFPIDVLPSWLRLWAEDQARAHQVPIDLPALAGLAVVSLVLAERGIEVCVREGWHESAPLQLVVGLQPGEHVAPVLEAATWPIRLWEFDRVWRRGRDVEGEEQLQQTRIELHRERHRYARLCDRYSPRRVSCSDERAKKRWDEVVSLACRMREDAAASAEPLPLLVPPHEATRRAKNPHAGSQHHGATFEAVSQEDGATPFAGGWGHPFRRRMGPPAREA
jgi:hypothetical protein